MRKTILSFALASAAMAGLLMAQWDPAAAQSPELQSLRGPTSLDETGAPPDLKSQNTNSGQFTRAYRQQPPLVPHKVDHYQIDLKVNQCLRCHDWPHNVQENAPKVSETHYIDRNGIALDQVARSRWFCNQCHVPQANTRDLVDNQFKSAIQVE